MRCIVHIGTEKTGTTAVQRFLSMHRKTLLKRGVLYPRRPGAETHMGVALYAGDFNATSDINAIFSVNTPEALSQFREDFVQGVAAEIASSESSVCVFSSEHCSSRLLTNDEVNRLQSYLHGQFEDVKVIVYLRRQDEFYIAQHSTAVKCGSTAKIAAPSAWDYRHRLDYDQLLQRWASCFGEQNMVVRRYVTGGAVTDFLEAASLQHLSDLQRPERINESLDPLVLEYLRLMNAHVPLIENGAVNVLRRDLVKMLEAVAASGQRYWDQALCSGIMDAVVASNRRVAEKWFPTETFNEGDPLFGPLGVRETVRHTDLSVADAVRLSAHLWIEQSRALLALRQKLEGHRSGAGHRDLGEHPS